MATQDFKLHSLVSWKAIFAGLFVALLVYAAMFFLGVGIGGITLAKAVNEGTSGTAVTAGTVIWFVLSTVLALIVGGYFAARVGNFVTERIGAAQGLVIAGFFHTVMYVQAIIAAGVVTVGVTSLAGVAASNLDDNPVVSTAVESAIGSANLKSDITTVTKEVTARIMRGDTQSAKNYLSYQMGSTQGVDEMIAQVEGKAKEVAENTGKAIAGVSWMMFLTLLLSSAGAVLGGSLGAKNNHRKPLDVDEVVPLSRYQSATK
jgi:hypothetical protein